MTRWMALISILAAAGLGFLSIIVGFVLHSQEQHAGGSAAFLLGGFLLVAAFFYADMQARSRL